MVAGFDDGPYAAFKIRQTVLKQRHATGTAIPFHALEARLRLLSENHRKLTLGFRQNIYPEMRAGTKMRKEGAGVVNADQDQRGLDGDRCKRANRQPMRRSVRRKNGGYGDSGGEFRTGFAKDFGA